MKRKYKNKEIEHKQKQKKNAHTDEQRGKKYLLIIFVLPKTETYSGTDENITCSRVIFNLSFVKNTEIVK